MDPTLSNKVLHSGILLYPTRLYTHGSYFIQQGVGMGWHNQYSRQSKVDITGVSYKWYPSVAGLPNLYSVIDG